MKRAIILNLVFLLAISATATAQIRRVPGEYPTIQAAIDASSSGDEVVVADGIYTGQGNRDIDPRGKAITIRSENGPEGCIIDCNGTKAEPHRGFYGNGNCILIGFTITGGYAQQGGAIYFRMSSPTIINCTIADNSAELGGGIYCGDIDIGSKITIINSRIIGNSAHPSITPYATPGGGGIYCRRSNITIINSQINQNSVYYGSGGGIYCQEGSSITLNNCTISKNTLEPYNKKSIGSGGGIYYNNDVPSPEIKFIIANCTISDNSSKGSLQSRGGGIYCYYRQGNPIITKCRISGNSAGGITFEQGNPIVTGCIISGNFPLNKEPFAGGGGIYCGGGNSTISNCTIVGNSFCGIYCRPSSPGINITITNSILYYNGDGRKYFEQIYGLPATVTYSDIQMYKPPVQPWPGVGNINADPCFADSGHWDANAVWIEGDYHLLADSPCIDTGGLTSYLLDNTDLDGNPRISGGRIDMGAYESKNNAPVANAGPDQTVYAWIDGLADVNLDGSASYDPDGDQLTYKWTWSVDGNTYDANGVSPTIELPVGEHTIQLIVNDGIDDSELDQVVINVIGPMESQLWISPQVIHRNNPGPKQVTALLSLSEGVAKDQIDNTRLLMLYPGGIGASNQYIFDIRSCSDGAQHAIIFASFDEDQLLDAVPDNGRVELRIVGRLKSGRYFLGCDTICTFQKNDV